mgnify:CR=1 FL=1
MTTTVAVAGKGGTGKTTFSALLIQLLIQRGTVLAIDADPSTNLHMALGLELDGTVGDAREEMMLAIRGGSFGVGMDKRSYLDMRINEALVESPGVDLLAMGRPEGPGCYCAANHLLRTNIDRLANGYDYVVIDNEAGLEHLSRQTTRDVDVLFLVSDPTLRGIVAAARAQELVHELRTRVGRVGLVVNRLNGQLPPELTAVVEQRKLVLWATFPEDPAVRELDAHGRPICELSADSPLRLAVAEAAKRAGLIS